MPRLDSNKKPRFKYCKVSDKATLYNLAISICQNSMVKASKADLRLLDQKNKFIEQNSVIQALFSKLASGCSLVW